MRFDPDAFFDGATAVDPNVYFGYGRRVGLRAAIGAPDPAVVQTYREGSFAYRSPVRLDRHSVTLTFLGPSKKPCARKFDVVANAKAVVASLAIAAVTGMPLAAVTRQLAVKVDATMMELRFSSIAGKAIVSAIGITR